MKKYFLIILFILIYFSDLRSQIDTVRFYENKKGFLFQDFEHSSFPFELIKKRLKFKNIDNQFDATYLTKVYNAHNYIMFFSSDSTLLLEYENGAGGITGQVKSYHSSGALKLIGVFRNYSYTLSKEKVVGFDGTVPTGEWVFYKKSGKIRKKLFFFAEKSIVYKYYKLK